MSDGKYRHVIWDWNGTLVDDFWLSHSIVNSYLSDLGLAEITPEQYKDSFAHPIKDFYIKLGLVLDQQRFVELSEHFLSNYQRGFSNCKLHIQAGDFIASLRARGITQSLLSAHPHELLMDNLATIGMENAFDQIVGLDNRLGDSKLSRGKMLIEQLPYSTSEIVMIGDTDHDHFVASGLGIDCVLISNGYQSQERLLKLGVPLFQSLTDLINSGTVV